MRIFRYALPCAFALTAGIARAEAPSVVVSIAPVHSLVASVMEGVGAPELLVPAGVSDHDYAMKPSDLRAIGGADLVVWMGEALETYLAKPLETEGARSLELLEVEAIEPHRYGESAEGDEDHPGEAAAHEGADDRGQDHLGVDPHVWLDPVRAKAIVGAVAEALAEIDPQNGPKYRENAASTATSLDALDMEIRRILAPFSAKPFVTFHDGYSYFVARYGLNQVGHFTAQPERAAGAATAQSLRQAVAAEGVACAFAEPQFDPDTLRALAGAAEIKVGVLDAIGSGLEPGPSLYAALMRRNAGAIEDCLASTS